MSRRPAFADIEPTVAQIESSVDDLIDGIAKECDSFVYLEWLCTSGEVREPSSYFGPISNDEMLKLLANPDSSPEQCKAIGSEIRRRFTDAHLEIVTERAKHKAAEEAETEVYP